MGEDSRSYGDALSASRDDGLAPAWRPAPGKQTLAQTGSMAGGRSSAVGDGGGARGGGGERAGAWVADDDLMAAMGLSDAR